MDLPGGQRFMPPDRAATLQGTLSYARRAARRQAQAGPVENDAAVETDRAMPQPELPSHNSPIVGDQASSLLGRDVIFDFPVRFPQQQMIRSTSQQTRAEGPFELGPNLPVRIGPVAAGGQGSHPLAIDARNFIRSNLPSFYSCLTSRLLKTCIDFAVDDLHFARDSLDVTQIRFKKSARSADPEAFFLHHGGLYRDGWSMQLMQGRRYELRERHEWGTSELPPRTMSFYNIDADALADKVLAADFFAIDFTFVTRDAPYGDAVHRLHVPQVSFGLEMTPVSVEADRAMPQLPSHNSLFSIVGEQARLIGLFLGRDVIFDFPAHFPQQQMLRITRQQTRAGVEDGPSLLIGIGPVVVGGGSRRLAIDVSGNWPLARNFIRSNLPSFYSCLTSCLLKTCIEFAVDVLHYARGSFDVTQIRLKMSAQPADPEAFVLYRDGWTMQSGRRYDLRERHEWGTSDFPHRTTSFYNIGAEALAERVLAADFFAIEFTFHDAPYGGALHGVHMPQVSFGLEMTPVTNEFLNLEERRWPARAPRPLDVFGMANARASRP